MQHALLTTLQAGARGAQVFLSDNAARYKALVEQQNEDPHDQHSHRSIGLIQLVVRMREVRKANIHRRLKALTASTASDSLDKIRASNDQTLKCSEAEMACL